MKLGFNTIVQTGFYCIHDLVTAQTFDGNHEGETETLTVLGVQATQTGQLLGRTLVQASATLFNALFAHRHDPVNAFYANLRALAGEVPFAEIAHKVRTVPPDYPLIRGAFALGTWQHRTLACTSRAGLASR